MDIERVLNILENYDNLTLTTEEKDSLIATLSNMDLGTLGPENRNKAEQILNGTVVEQQPVMENLEEVPVESNIVTEQPVQETQVVTETVQVQEPVVQEQPVLEAVPVVEEPTVMEPIDIPVADVVESNIVAEPVMDTPVTEPVVLEPVSMEPTPELTPEPLPITEEAPTPEVLPQTEPAPMAVPLEQVVMDEPVVMESVELVVEPVQEQPVEAPSEPVNVYLDPNESTNSEPMETLPEQPVAEVQPAGEQTMQAIEPEKPKKKKTGLIIIIIVALIAVICGVLFVLDSQGIITIPFLHPASKNPVTTENKTLSCSVDATSEANLDAKNVVEVVYDSTGKLYKITLIYNYQYDDEATYSDMKNSYVLPDNYAGVNHSSSYDDDKLTFIVTMVIEYDKLDEAEKSKYDYLLVHADAKTFYLNSGYTCDGETGNNEDPDPTPDPNTDPDPDPNNEDPDVTMYPIGEAFAMNNSLFEYTNVVVKEYDSSYSSMEIDATLKNISQATQMRNIRIKFYDADKKLIGEAQEKTQLTVDDDSPFAVKAGESKEFTFKFYDQRTGFSLANVKYVSISDIEV